MTRLSSQTPLPIYFERTITDRYEDLLFFPTATDHSSPAAGPGTLPNPAVSQLGIKKAHSVMASSTRDQPKSPFRPESKFSLVTTLSSSGPTVCLRDLELIKG
ncbi:uncharacterized protein CTRU02_215414 [Colletotrichum truncatum]|uniref:Uncharacterized protein n=2 Tax=Colletotrichum truncatum TaxID=5467 RepID=A0ACC3YCG5_COLTU|nr:uncharacterized protein CTRU02_15803 [Colletotrichum truncatum]XP_036584326.1 uncharacterized protein CTRU02_05401 [Colletotrichum truncatum]XP_036584570.1 uncharacterized protein CTRU02_05645 [Colletotrichum truncatum]KAF6780651.1 hypothetical protein CTRU02_15803 [Colletotrichum truncatum]KAF6793844.1 hypothetical protein CTRU02_05401 [Colletotrichum truncatum]KAF6794088.1 hypothetical protein CTRU02_05645 [Colletotrichum truncatum]